MNIHNMHDWILKRIEFDWRTARAIMELEATDFTEKRLIAEGVQDLRIPQANGWGRSISVNEVSEVKPTQSGLSHLSIEMQSGDTIQIVAQHFVFPAPYEK